MGTLERRERERGELRKRILDAARDLFASEGYTAVSMRRIAEAIEYTPAALYSHFRDKQALVDEMCRQDFGAFAAKFAEAAGLADPIARIHFAGRKYIEFAVTHPNHFRVMFMTPIPACELTTQDQSRKEDPNQNGYLFLRHAVAQGIEQGRFRAGLSDVELLSQTLWAAVHGVATLEVTMRQDPWFEWRSLERRTDLMLDAVLGGLLAGGSEAR